MAPPHNPDLKLVQKAVQGNRKAFTALFDRHFQSVYNFALMLSSDPALAEDLTQEAFIRAHAKLHSLGPPWNFRAWIFRLTRNYFIDLTRKDRKVDPLEEGLPVKSPGPGPERETMSIETADRVQNTLNKLSPQHREILVLRELNEFSYAEIGEILNIRDSNVKISIHRARAAFQESYGIQLLLEDPEGECQEVAGLLGSLHDNEELLDQKRFVKEHLKECAECQERRQMLIDQSVIFGAFIPIIPPKALAERILQQTAVKNVGAQPGSGLQILGYGGAAAVLGAALWLLFALIFNTKSILPNFPGGSEGDSPEAVASVQSSPTVPIDQPPPPPPLVPPSPERCKLFGEPVISLVLLNIPAETMILPLYFKVEGGIPGLGLDIPDDPDPWDYNAFLGATDSNLCSLQGFDDRLYCMFTLPPDAPGTALDLTLFLNGCDNPVISMPAVTIPEPLPAKMNCNKDLSEEDCEAAGGTYQKPASSAPFCDCP